MHFSSLGTVPQQSQPTLIPEPFDVPTHGYSVNSSRAPTAPNRTSLWSESELSVDLNLSMQRASMNATVPEESKSESSTDAHQSKRCHQEKRRVRSVEQWNMNGEIICFSRERDTTRLELFRHFELFPLR